MNYQERLQGLAEKMAIVTFERFIAPSDRPEMGWSGLSDTDKKTWVDSEMEQARIAVAEMAEAYEWGHHDGWMSKAMNFNQLDSPSLKEGKIKSGLIPDDGQGANLEYDRKGSVHNPDNPEPEQGAGSDAT